MPVVDQPARSAMAGFCFSELPCPSSRLCTAHLGRGTRRRRNASWTGSARAARRGYGPRWRRARAEYLARHPLCVRCQADGCIKPSTTVDHIVPHRGDQKLFWNEANWAALCKRCHDAKTAREGRWG